MSNEYNPSIQKLDHLDWLTTFEAAIYIRAVNNKGEPNPKTIRNLVGQRRLTPHKPFGKLLFNRLELKKLIETSRLG